MPKIKTRKAAAKRLKVTGTGRLMTRHTQVGHLRRKKNGTKWRRLSQDLEVASAVKKNAYRMIPNA